MVWSDKGMLRVIGCGGEGIASPHTPKKISVTPTPGPRDQTRHSRGHSLSSTAGPLLPQAPTEREEKSDRHEACRPALGSRPSPGSKVDEPCQANGHEVDMAILNLMSWASCLDDSCFPFVSSARRCCSSVDAVVVFSPSILASAFLTQPLCRLREDRHNWQQPLSLVSQSFRPPCQSDRRQ